MTRPNPDSSDDPLERLRADTGRIRAEATEALRADAEAMRRDLDRARRNLESPRFGLAELFAAAAHAVKETTGEVARAVQSPDFGRGMAGVLSAALEAAGPAISDLGSQLVAALDEALPPN